jgi:hypothetical protein
MNKVLDFSLTPALNANMSTTLNCFFGGGCEDLEEKYKSYYIDSLTGKSHTPRLYIINMILDCSEPYVSFIPYHVWCFLVQMDGPVWKAYLKNMDNLEALETWRSRCLLTLFRIQSEAEKLHMNNCMEKWAFFIIQRINTDYLNIDFYRKHQTIFRPAYRFERLAKSGSNESHDELMFPIDIHESPK